MRTHIAVSYVLLAALSAGCTTALPSRAPRFASGNYVDATQVAQHATGIGFESQDMRSLTDVMVRDLLATPLFGNAGRPPRVIIDDTRFVNESNQVVNLNLLLDRLRIDLMRASAGRILFVSRQNADLVQHEHELKNEGAVDGGSRPTRDALAGADFRLIGRIASQSTANSRTGVRSNYYQFSFEMLDLGSGMSVWGNLYDLKKAGANDTVYN